ncbi:MAG: hypothetical protein ACUVQG_13160 [Thermogutta sp.]
MAPAIRCGSRLLNFAVTLLAVFTCVPGEEPLSPFSLAGRSLCCVASVSGEEHSSSPTIGGLALPKPPDSLRNPWPEEWELAFQARVAHTISFFDSGGKGRYGTTYFESEKWSYPKAMFDFLAGNRESALAFLQAEDADAKKWHVHTLGIDLYPCFTLKGQVRKYFLFGPFLDRDYRQRMYRAAQLWTVHDPAEVPHPLFGEGKGGDGWTPEIRGFQVDRRSTDNLRIMREVAVYLFAEETGNRATQAIYREKLIDYVRSLYRNGMSEWDSENYLTHGISAWLNLYDFAKDEEMKALAKAALDWLCIAGALKYYRGGMLGPSCRDYGGGNVVFGSLSSHMLHLWFGDCPISDPRPSEDEIHAVTSAYRPPQAAVLLARKDFPRPVEMVNTKPVYAYWAVPQGRDRPRYWETLYFARTYQLGSLAADLPPNGNAENCRVMSLGAFSSKRGVDYVIVQTDPPGAHAAIKPNERIAQYRNVLVWMRESQPGEKFFLQIPLHATIHMQDDTSLIGLEKTFILVRTFRLGPWQKYADKTGAVYADETFWGAQSADAGLCGLVLEVGEQPEFKDLEQFRSRSDSAFLDLTRLENEKEVFYRAISGQTLRVKYASETTLPIIERDGTPFRPAENFDVYRALDTPLAKSPVSQMWNSGKLTVRAGGQVFSVTVSTDGKVEWDQSP